MNVCLLNCIMSLKNSANFLSAMECEEFNELAPRFYLRANNCQDFYYVETNMTSVVNPIRMKYSNVSSARLFKLQGSDSRLKSLWNGHVTRYDGHSKLLSPVKASNSQDNSTGSTSSLWNGIALLGKRIFFESTLLERKCGHPSGMADWGGVGVEVVWWRLPPPSTSCHSMTITVLAASTHSRSSVAERK